MRFFSWLKKMHTPAPGMDPDLVLVAYALIFVAWCSVFSAVVLIVVDLWR